MTLSYLHFTVILRWGIAFCHLRAIRAAVYLRAIMAQFISGGGPQSVAVNFSYPLRDSQVRGTANV